MSPHQQSVPLMAIAMWPSPEQDVEHKPDVWKALVSWKVRPVAEEKQPTGTGDVVGVSDPTGAGTGLATGLGLGMGSASVVDTPRRTVAAATMNPEENIILKNG